MSAVPGRKWYDAYSGPLSCEEVAMSTSGHTRARQGRGLFVDASLIAAFPKVAKSSSWVVGCNQILCGRIRG